MSDKESVLVGTLGKPHGLRGEVTVYLHTDEPERRFAPGTDVVVAGRPGSVASSRWHNGVLLVGLAGITDRTTAEGLRGAEVWIGVPGDEEPAEDGEFYDRQLIGLEVRDAAGVVLGRVSAVQHPPAQDQLVVDVAGQDRLVPFVEALVPEVDVAAGYLVVADIPGLLFEAE
ncbi:ribosome maturation factor RimM [Nigerium massiliense]|uniref:ribosome maturation factor RimM n=1 Tax=Nigerium massiliense TaxID=1522317 RepID=UPI00058DD559|nr:ribosome maturation factor RimM [Nigerium massiliense]